MSQVHEFMLRSPDQTLRTVRASYGEARLRSGELAKGVVLTFSKDGKEHTTVMFPDEAIRLAMMLLDQALFRTSGRNYNEKDA